MNPSLLVTLELDRGSDPISGLLSTSGTAPAHFDGYIQLISALERLQSTDSSSVGREGRWTGCDRREPGDG